MGRREWTGIGGKENGRWRMGSSKGVKMEEEEKGEEKEEGEVTGMKQVGTQARKEDGEEGRVNGGEEGREKR